MMNIRILLKRGSRGPVGIFIAFIAIFFATVTSGIVYAQGIEGPLRPPVNMDTEDLIPPQWIKYTWRMAAVEGTYGSWNGHNLDDIMSKVKSTGAQAIWHRAKTGGYLYWPSETGVVDPALGEHDNVLEGLNAAHAQGLKYVTYVNPLDDQAAEQHPDWGQRNASGTLISNKSGYRLSVASPAREHIQAQLVELVTNYDIDGIWLDMVFWHRGGDYNPYSVQEFKTRYGFDPPLEEDPDDPKWQKWIQFNYDMITETFVQWNRAVKAVNPDVALMANTFSGWVYRNPGNGRSSVDVVKGLDAVLEEVGWYNGADPNFFGFPARESFMSLFLSSIASNNALADEQKKVAHIWSAGAFQGKESSKMEVASIPQELKSRAMEAITYGAIPWPVFYNGQGMNDLFCDIEAIEPWLKGAERVPWAALVVSENTEFWYGKTDPINRYVKSLYGIFDVFAEEHMPLEIITDRELEEGNLSPYKVIVLANTAALSDNAAQKLKDYVNNEGGLLATYESGLYDEAGTERVQNVLQDLLGFNVENRMATNNILYLQAPTSGHPSINARVREYIADYSWDRTGIQKGGNVPYSGLAGTGVLGQAMNKNESVLKAATKINGNPSYDVMIARQYAQGKVAYIPLDIGTAYYRGRAPYLRQWVAGAVRWAATEAPPVVIKAPLVVQSSVFHKADTLIVHLLNDISSFGRATVANGDQLGIREEVLPVYDIEVTFRTGDKKYGEFRLQPGNVLLEGNKNKDGTITVTVPKLETHVMLVAKPDSGITGMESAKGVSLSASVFPNPTTGDFFLRVDESDVLHLSYYLYDMNGKLLETKKLENNETSIVMSSLMPAIYFLKVTDGNKRVKTFKIIKS